MVLFPCFVVVHSAMFYFCVDDCLVMSHCLYFMKHIPLQFCCSSLHKFNVHYNKISSGAISIQDNNKTLTNSEPSTSKELSHNADQNHPEDGDQKLPSEQISCQIVVHHADGEFLYLFFFFKL